MGSKNNIEKYSKDPYHCSWCNNIIPYEIAKIRYKCRKDNKSGNIFCNRKCFKNYTNNVTYENRHIGNKICKTCKENKPKTEFYFANNEKTRYAVSCKKCASKEQILRNRNNPNRKDILRRCTYGIEPEEYEMMKINQNYSCKICKRQIRLCIDHDHKTGKIRGLLCQRCNAGLGLFLDDIALFNEAIKYLQESKND